VKWRWLAVVPLLAVLALPMVVPRIAATRGVQVVSTSWCVAGLCLRGVNKGTAHAETVEIGWTGTLRLSDVEAPLPTGGGSGSGGLPFRRVEVERLRVIGLPLPPLSGSLVPERHLVGEHIEIRGDTATAEFVTPAGAVSIQARRDGEILSFAVRGEGLRVSRPDLAPEPWAVPRVIVEGAGSLTEASGTWSVGAVRGVFTATRDGSTPRVTFTLPPTRIDSVYAALAGIVPELGRATIGGTLTATGDWTWPDGPIHVLPVVEGFTVTGLVPPAFASGPFTFRGFDAERAPIAVTTGEGTPGWLELRRAGRWLPRAVVAAEDSAYWRHASYDIDGMLAAADANTDAGDIVRGGSTLSQQLAKNVFLDPSRTYQRKLREALYARDLEGTLGKERVLEIYLNVVEWGPGIRGAAQAANVYFLKSPDGLLPEEAAWLASILRSPRKAYTAQYLVGRADRIRLAWVLDNMVDLEKTERSAAKSRPIRFVPP